MKTLKILFIYFPLLILGTPLFIAGAIMLCFAFGPDGFQRLLRKLGEKS